MTEPQAPGAPTPPAAQAPGPLPRQLRLHVPLLLATLLALLDLYLWVPGPGLLLAAALSLLGFANALTHQLRRDPRLTRTFSAACIYGIAVAAIIGGVRYQEEQAQLRAAVLIVATETYRHQSGEWPDSLERLVPRFMARIPSVSLRPGHRFSYGMSGDSVALEWRGVLPGSQWRYEFLLAQTSHDRMLMREPFRSLLPFWWSSPKTPAGR